MCLCLVGGGGVVFRGVVDASASVGVLFGGGGACVVFLVAFIIRFKRRLTDP